MLRQQGFPIRFACSSENLPPDTALVRTEYLGKTILYDLWDGYHNPTAMRLGLNQADFYFKRSFSREKNQLLFPEDCPKMYPLGFNYHVAYPGTPFAEPLWKSAAKSVLGRVPERYFTPDKFEGSPKPSQQPPNILFLTRLWDPREPGLSEAAGLEREQINHTRIAVLRALSEQYGPRFIGGLNDTPLSRMLAPELIVPDSLTNRKQYLRLLRESDICIATTGLHGSIGWKTGEYVAAAKAIVSEPLGYEVPGDFRNGTHYLSFTSPEECLTRANSLLDNPDKLLSMQRANEAYYQNNLRPDVLVKNTLAIVKQQTPP